MLFPTKLFAAMESVNSAQNQDFSNGTLFAEINSPMLVITDSSTLEKKQSFFQEVHTLLDFMYVKISLLSMFHDFINIS